MARFKTLEEKIKIVDELFSGKTLSELSGDYECAEQSIYNWSQKYDDMKAKLAIQQQSNEFQKTIEKDVDSKTLNNIIKANLNLTDSVNQLIRLLAKKN